MGDPTDHSEALRNVGALEAAEERAFKRGRDSAQLGAQVDSHEKRLNAINGSIARHAKAQEHTNDRLEDLTRTLAQSTAVAKARADTAAELAKTAAENAVSKRTFIVTVVFAAASVAGVLIGALQLSGHG